MDQKISQINPPQQQHSTRESVVGIQRKKQQLLRINADDYSTKHLVIFWVVFASVIILITIIASQALPETFRFFTNREMTQRTTIINCTNPIGFNENNSIYCRPPAPDNPYVGLLFRDLSSKNQFVQIYINVVLRNKALPYLQLKQKVSIQLNQLSKQITNNHNVDFKKNSYQQNYQFEFSMLSSESQRIYEDNGFMFKGYRKSMGIMKQIQGENALLMLKFERWPLENVMDVYLDYTTVNAEFTVYTILIRYILFAITLATTIIYYLRYRIIPEKSRTLEQKWIFYLSIFTVLFNDPFYAITLLEPNGFTAFTSVLFIVNFITFLIAFWMVFIERIYYESGQEYENVVNRYKFVYFGILYVTFFVLQFQLVLLRLNDQAVLPSQQLQKTYLKEQYIVSLLVFLCGIVYIVIRYCQCFPTLVDKIWRNQIFLIFSVFFIIIIVVLFIVNGLGVYEYIGDRILILFVVMNMYTIYLQYMYSVTKMQMTKLQGDFLLNSVNKGDQNHQIQTIISNFGNEDVILDLDSEDGAGSIFYKNGDNKVDIKVQENQQFKKQVQMQRQEQRRSEQQSENENEIQQNGTITALHQQEQKQVKQNKSFGQFELQ